MRQVPIRPDPGYSRPGSARIASPEGPWRQTSALARHFLPRPGGVCGRRIWLEGRGQSWPDHGAGRDQGTANAGRRPPGAPASTPPSPPPCWPHCPEGCRPRAARVPGFPPPAQPREGPAPHSSGGGTVGFVYSFIYLECIRGGELVPRYVSGGQRTTCDGSFSLSITWFLATELRSTRCPDSPLRANFFLPNKGLKSSHRCRPFTHFKSPPPKTRETG